MASPYATLNDLTTWIGAGLTVPGAAEAARLLKNASLLIDSELVGITYDVDVNGMPTLAAVVQAFNDACCAQVEYWLETGDEYGDGEFLQGYSIEGASVQYRSPPPRLALRARDVFRVAGLLPSQTPIHMP